MAGANRKRLHPGLQFLLWALLIVGSVALLALIHQRWNVEINWAVREFGWMLQLLTLVGLWMAVYQIRQGDEVAGSLSTRYLATFPDYMASLEGHLLKAEEHITIICSTPIVGQVSAPALAASIRLTLQKKMNEGVAVDLIYNSADVRKQTHRQQFTDKRWKTWRDDNVAAIGEFIERFVPDKPAKSGAGTPPVSIRTEYRAASDKVAFVKTLELEKFLPWVVEANDVSLQRLKEGPSSLNAVEVAEELHFHAWIVDRKEAMFAFPKTDEDHSGFCFLTRDMALVRGLLHLADQWMPRE